VILEAHEQVTGFLNGPGIGGMGGDARKMDAPRLVLTNSTYKRRRNATVDGATR
jgi:hypothetical protein